MSNEARPNSEGKRLLNENLERAMKSGARELPGAKSGV